MNSLLENMNYVAIFVASIVGYIIPMIWYMPNLFGNTWMKYAGVKEMKPSIGVMLKGFIVLVIFNMGIAWVIAQTGATTFLEGVKIGAIVWLGFIATSQLDAVLYAKKPMSLYWITSIQYLISMTIVSGIISVWK
jgi:hypothetical protein